MGVIDYINQNQYVSYYIRGYFEAPANGTYIFFMSADKNAEFFIQKTPNNLTFSTNSTPDCIISDYNYYRNYLYPYESNDFS